MRNLRTRHFGHGCIFTSLICTVLFFIYLNYIEVNLLLKNVPLKGTGPYQPFFTKFSSNFSNNSKQIRPQLKINKVENKLDQYIKATNNIVISPELDYLKEDLRKYMKEKFPEKVKLIRNDKREGLIRGRMIGAINATGEVLVFLDSHCEVNKMWLQPLLFAIQKDYRMVVCPLIDAISAYTLKYMSSPILRGGFTWNLHFKWEQVPPSNLLGPEGAAAPIKSPTMAGGIFAINRQYFFEIGQYDSGMNTWGGENLEISFRIWMYGGKLFVIPCSRVGHISRKMLSHKAYEIMDSLQSNSLRLAHVWLDEYKVRINS